MFFFNKYVIIYLIILYFFILIVEVRRNIGVEVVVLNEFGIENLIEMLRIGRWIGVEIVIEIEIVIIMVVEIGIVSVIEMVGIGIGRVVEVEIMIGIENEVVEDKVEVGIIDDFFVRFFVIYICLLCMFDLCD